MVLLAGCQPFHVNAETSAAAPQSACPPIQGLSGKLPGDIFGNRKDAEKVADILLNKLYSKSELRRFDDLDIQDEGVNWRFRQTLPKGVYGGGASFSVSKCTGEVSNIDFEE
ncbi:MAG: hypothetical protein Q8J89_14510 [Caulobacter sp.]|nr:hypothetical protein [Caulobacter sp.]